jgi:hypothetical protein
MKMFAGLEVGFKRTAICVVDGRGEIVWRGIVDTHPEGAARVHGYHGSQSPNRMRVTRSPTLWANSHTRCTVAPVGLG